MCWRVRAVLDLQPHWVKEGHPDLTYFLSPENVDFVTFWVKLLIFGWLRAVGLIAFQSQKRWSIWWCLHFCSLEQFPQFTIFLILGGLQHPVSTHCILVHMIHQFTTPFWAMSALLRIICTERKRKQKHLDDSLLGSFCRMWHQLLDSSGWSEEFSMRWATTLVASLHPLLQLLFPGLL